MGTTIEDLRALRDLRLTWLQWRITRVKGVITARGQVTPGWTYVARPVDEQRRPPVWELEQLHRGLANRVEASDLGELERRIGEQDRLRWVMYRAGEHPFDGSTYVEAELCRAGIFHA